MSDWENSDSWNLELLEAPSLFLYLSVSLHLVCRAQQFQGSWTFHRAVWGSEGSCGRWKRTRQGLDHHLLPWLRGHIGSLPPHSISQDNHKDNPPSRFKGRGHRLQLLVRLWQGSGGACGIWKYIAEGFGRYDLSQKITFIFSYQRIEGIVFYQLNAYLQEHWMPDIGPTFSSPSPQPCEAGSASYRDCPWIEEATKTV